MLIFFLLLIIYHLDGEFLCSIIAVKWRHFMIISEFYLFILLMHLHIFIGGELSIMHIICIILIYMVYNFLLNKQIRMSLPSAVPISSGWVTYNYRNLTLLELYERFNYFNTYIFSISETNVMIAGELWTLNRLLLSLWLSSL